MKPSNSTVRRSRRLTIRGTTIRTRREDGEETKARIVEAAGVLFAEHGFSEVTSKEICEAAGTNLTAVNYHFGSREGLYLTVLDVVHEHFSSPDFYAELMASEAPAREKLSRLMDKLTDNVYHKDSWQIKLWAREVMSPSQISLEMQQERTVPKFAVMEGLIGEITGVSRGTVAMSFCFINVMAPFMVLLIMGRNRYAPEAKLIALGPEKLSRHLKNMVFAGLDSFARHYAAGDVDLDDKIENDATKQ